MPVQNISEVDSQALERAINGITAEMFEMQAVWNTLIQHCWPVLEHSWYGPARDAFEQQYATFLSEFGQLQNDLYDQNEHLKLVAAWAVAAEDAAYQMAAGMFG